MTVEAAAAAIASGRIVGVPTDTVYGLAVDPLDPVAVSSLYEAKQRPTDKPVALLVPSLASIRELVALPPPAMELARAHWPGALTLVLKTLRRLPDWVGDPERGTVGVRMPAGDVVLSLLEATGPLAVTSANRSGEPPALDDVAAQRVFGDLVAVYLPGGCPGGTSSTVVDLTGGEPEILRPGPIEL
jgi:L-threonylcarbamoyladenylate synthase